MMKPVSTRDRITLELVGGMSPEQKAMTRQRAKSLLESGSDTSPVQHWTQGLARVVQGGIGGWQQAQAANADREAASLQRQALTDALAGGDLGNAATTLLNNAGTADQGVALAGKVIADRQARARAEAERNQPLTPMQQADLEYKRAQTDKLRRDDGSQIITVNGRVLSVAPDGTATEVFNAQPQPDERTQAEIELTRAKTEDLRRRGEGGGFADPKQRLEAEASLRKEFTAVAKEFRAIGSSYARIEASSGEPSAAGDMALIFNFMKMLDPGSVVRETEFANAQNAAGVPARIRAYYNNILSGERLTEGQRADFLAQAKNLYDRAEQDYIRIRKQYEPIATGAGLDPNRALLDFRSLPQERAQIQQRLRQAEEGGESPQIVEALRQADQAIARGADPQAVMQRLQQNGIR